MLHFRKWLTQKNIAARHTMLKLSRLWFNVAVAAPVTATSPPRNQRRTKSTNRSRGSGFVVRGAGEKWSAQVVLQRNLLVRYTRALTPEEAAQAHRQQSERLFFDFSDILSTKILRVLEGDSSGVDFKTQRATGSFVATGNFTFQLKGSVLDTVPKTVVDKSQRTVPVPTTFDIVFDPGHAIMLRKLATRHILQSAGFASRGGHGY